MKGKTKQNFQYGWNNGKLIMEQVPLTQDEKELLEEIREVSFLEMGERTRVGSGDDQAYADRFYNQLKNDSDSNILVEIVFRLTKNSLMNNKMKK